jgi:hypothetical protein
MDAAPLVVASQASRTLARSALPGAPVEHDRTGGRARRWRPAAASLLRRAAARVDNRSTWELSTGR